MNSAVYTQVDFCFGHDYAVGISVIEQFTIAALFDKQTSWCSKSMEPKIILAWPYVIGAHHEQ